MPGVAGVQADESDGIVTARIESALGIDIRADVARVLSARWRLLALRSESLTLEEIFLKLDGGRVRGHVHRHREA